MAEKISSEGKRIHDEAPSDAFAQFMRGGWAPSPLTGIAPSPAIDWCVKRRAKLSAAFSGLRIVLPSVITETAKPRSPLLLSSANFLRAALVT